jgi:hypothetical protein
MRTFHSQHHIRTGSEATRLLTNRTKDHHQPGPVPICALHHHPERPNMELPLKLKDGNYGVQNGGYLRAWR